MLITNWKISLILLALVFAVGSARADGSGDPAVASNDNGKYADKDGNPTYNIHPDGTVDWYTYSGYRRYHSDCHVCHGPNGDGKGERAERLSVAPADFGDSHAMGLHTDGELFWMITEGHKPMPAFRGTLTDEQRWHLVDYVRSFSKKP